MSLASSVTVTVASKRWKLALPLPGTCASVTVIGSAVSAARAHGSFASSDPRSRVVKHLSGTSVLSSVAGGAPGVVFANTSSVSNSAQSGDGDRHGRA